MIQISNIDKTLPRYAFYGLLFSKISHGFCMICVEYI